MNVSGHIPSAREILMLDRVGEDRFRARHNVDNFVGATFGGQLLGQSLAAARATVDIWPASSLSGTFIRAGKLDQPMEFVVARVNDGRRFAFRHVTAVQGDRTVFAMHCSFHAQQDGVAHQVDDIGAVRPPEALPDLRALAVTHGDRLSPRIAAIFASPFPIEIRPLDPDLFPNAQNRDIWFRIPTGVDVPAIADHQALLAVMSDYWLPGAIVAHHVSDDAGYAVTSLNHAMWFHHATRVDEWLLYRSTSHWAGRGRGLAPGLIFDRAGRLVATTTQEALVSVLPRG